MQERVRIFATNLLSGLCFFNSQLKLLERQIFDDLTERGVVNYDPIPGLRLVFESMILICLEREASRIGRKPQLVIVYI